MTLFDDPAPTASRPSVRVRLLVAYDGSGFHGFAAQPGVPTVGGTLAEAIEKVARVPVELTCAGRTDAGVHAWGQVVHVDLPAGTDLERLHRSLLKLCGPRIVVREVEVVADDFDARFSARSRTYRYRVLNAPVPDPFTAHLAWHVAAPLDTDLLALACDPFLGEHDFSAFCRRPPVEGASMTRRVRTAEWKELGDGLLRFDVEASAFCHQMVRSLVGTMVAVGRGKKRAGDMAFILRSGDRKLAGQPAPPDGLVLWEVLYPE